MTGIELRTLKFRVFKGHLIISVPIYLSFSLSHLVSISYFLLAYILFASEHVGCHRVTSGAIGCLAVLREKGYTEILKNPRVAREALACISFSRTALIPNMFARKGGRWGKLERHSKCVHFPFH